ncbi:biotin/lipoyl-binding protein [Nannocystis pusilla]|uniref:Biotin/lipoyl-binding protein n=1 Tax=Nannocystis pusilla TaxID=889268 RepID=A0A9X3IZM9_9BACT|nr:biotin/lipoyl-binding protein [Nannocystis pusilla]MCY1008113.1 biotin/lipoyl-binding protein [Nannocystis pusilla]
MSLRVVRTRIAPWGLWCATMAGVAWLWGDVHDEAAVGFVLAAEYELATPEPARVAAVAVTPGQRVRAGEVLVSLDAQAIDAELAIVAAERARLEAELGAVRAESRVRVGDTTREFDESVAAADVALRTARAERKAAAAEYAALSEQVATLGGLVEQRMADRRELDALRVEHVALEKQLQTADALIPQLVSQAAAARARRAALPADATEAALRPVQAELAVVERQEQLLAVRREAMSLRAVVDGDVAAVHLQAGEVADTGLPIVTLVGDAAAAEVQVCQREAQAGRGRPGEAVRVRPRGSAGAEAGVGSSAWRHASPSCRRGAGATRSCPSGAASWWCASTSRSRCCRDRRCRCASSARTPGRCQGRQHRSTRPAKSSARRAPASRRRPRSTCGRLTKSLSRRVPAPPRKTPRRLRRTRRSQPRARWSSRPRWPLARASSRRR